MAALLHDIGWKLARPRAELGDHAASNVAGLDSIAAEEGILAFCGEQLDGYGASDTSVSAEQQKAQHDVIGSTWLQMRGFAYAVAHLVEGHVLAKRYLTGTDTGYFDQLEQDSVRTLRFQGGPMDEQEARILRTHGPCTRKIRVEIDPETGGKMSCGERNNLSQDQIRASPGEGNTYMHAGAVRAHDTHTWAARRGVSRKVTYDWSVNTV
eukprot:COSAG01_NODE_6886_length_3451_cov_3.142601_2_plen_210_part_00